MNECFGLTHAGVSQHATLALAFSLPYVNRVGDTERHIWFSARYPVYLHLAQTLFASSLDYRKGCAHEFD